MSFLKKIAKCNQFIRENVEPFFVENQQIGWTLCQHKAILQQFPEYFLFAKDRIILNPIFSNYQSRSQMMATVVSELKQQGHISQWRGELYDIVPKYGQSPLLAVERGATAFFGFAAFGTHLNGYTYCHDQLYIWVAKRAKNLVVAPGLLDNIAAGGLPKDITPKENIIKEAWEEAQLPKSLTEQASANGFVSYISSSPQGISPEMIFLYDLELPSSVIPRINYNEVDSFSCLPATEVYNLVKDTQQFKANSAIIMIDFLLRKNIIDSSEPDFQKLKASLRSSFEFETGYFFK